MPMVPVESEAFHLDDTNDWVQDPPEPQAGPENAESGDFGEQREGLTTAVSTPRPSVLPTRGSYTAAPGPSEEQVIRFLLRQVSNHTDKPSCYNLPRALLSPIFPKYNKRERYRPIRWRTIPLPHFT